MSLQAVTGSLHGLKVNLLKSRLVSREEEYALRKPPQGGIVLPNQHLERLVLQPSGQMKFHPFQTVALDVNGLRPSRSVGKTRGDDDDFVIQKRRAGFRTTTKRLRARFQRESISRLISYGSRESALKISVYSCHKSGPFRSLRQRCI